MEIPKMQANLNFQLEILKWNLNSQAFRRKERKHTLRVNWILKKPWSKNSNSLEKMKVEEQLSLAQGCLTFAFVDIHKLEVAKFIIDWQSERARLWAYLCESRTSKSVSWSIYWWSDYQSWSFGRQGERLGFTKFKNRLHFTNCASVRPCELSLTLTSSWWVFKFRI